MMNGRKNRSDILAWIIPLWVYAGCWVMGVSEAAAQEADYWKLSPMLRQLVNSRTSHLSKATGRHDSENPPIPHQALHSSPYRGETEGVRPTSVCAFVQLATDNEQVLQALGCRSLAKFGNLHIADIPLSQLGSLSRDANVLRIEARESHSLLLDTTINKLNTKPIYEGKDLPQAFTGKGVVMGLEDIGFDLTHPNFRSSDMQELRIRRFWDHLSTDTVGSNMYVGAEYTTPEDILAYGRSRDGLAQYHGTHTLGIAAGNGYDTPYHGVAYESDICLVSNTVSDDLEFISEEDRYKYTSATDMLGFKYILDYAEAEGKPCVVSFSEGSHQDFMGDDVLMYAFLDSLVGPGRIIVASAGNEGHYGTYLHKPRGEERMNTYLSNGPNNVFFTMRSDDHFDLAVRFYVDKENPYEHLLHSIDVIAEEDSLVEDTIMINDEEYIIKMAGYPSCYNPEQMAFEVFIQVAQHNFGYSVPVEVEMIGADSDVELFRVTGKFKYKDRQAYDEGPGEHSHSIYSPGSAPAVICVGATAYRQGYTDINDKYWTRDWGTGGVIADYTSAGPTFDERIKPDVVANGTNVISSSSAYYLEEHNQPIGMYVYTNMSEFEGRQYPWRLESGTSMSTPAVAGTIALWLQAKPDLTPADIKNVLAQSCRPLDESMPIPNNRWGYGEIDAYRGLLYILGYSGIKEISQEQPHNASFSVNSEGILSIRLEHPAHESIRLSIYAVGGQRIMTQTLPKGQDIYDIPMSQLPHGVYAVQLSSQERSVHGSTLIRR